MRRAIIVAMLLSVALLPNIGATGGVIDEVVLTGDGGVGEGPIDVNITVIGVGGASSSSVSWNATLSDLDGNQIDSDSGNLLVDDGVEVYVETTLGNAPVGLSNLTISISGDVGTPGQDQWTTYYKVIQRLRPLEVSLGTPLFTSVDSSNLETGNFSLSDGDFARIDVPVINSGDFPWNGSLNLSIDSVDFTPKDVNISSDSTVVLSFLSTQLSEGTHNLNLSLDGPDDSDTSDNSVSLTFEVEPPPLPAIELSLSRESEPVAGLQMEWTLDAYNSGVSTFDGKLICSHEGEEVFSTNTTIAIGESKNFTVSMTSKPGELVCTTSDARTSVTVNATDLLSMESAIFVGAGYSTPTLLGGPWHSGDEITFSLLVRNEGDSSGSANLRIEIAGEIQNSSSITLEQGKAGEVGYQFSFPSSGDHIVNWSLISPDGLVDANLSGSLLVPVMDSQVLNINIESVDVVDDGVEISWAIDLSDGKERLVILSFCSVNDGLKGQKIYEERNLLPGRTFGKMNIGFQNGQEVYAAVSESGWTIGFGSFTEDEAPMPDYNVIPDITVNPTTQPKLPSAGSDVTVYYTISNSVVSVVPPGQVVITDVNGYIIGSDSTSEITSGSKDSSTVVSWPSGDNVKIIVTWHVDGQTVSDEIMVSSEKVEASEDDFSIPWGGILGGLALGMVLIFAVRIKNSPPRDKDKKSKSPKKSATKTDEKVEVACPSCDRRLRVPKDYTGSVRCPECETKFDVEAEEEPEDEIQEDPIDQVEKEDDTLWSASDDDILGCPKCTRKLKVPFDRRPAKARCPACETIFEARKS